MEGEKVRRGGRGRMDGRTDTRTQELTGGECDGSTNALRSVEGYGFCEEEAEAETGLTYQGINE